MTESQYEAHMKAFTAAVARAEERAPRIELDLGWQELTVMIAMVQLALRHPHNTGHARAIAEAIVQRIVCEVYAVDPVLARLMQMGEHRVENDIA